LMRTNLFIPSRFWTTDTKFDICCQRYIATCGKTFSYRCTSTVPALNYCSRIFFSNPSAIYTYFTATERFCYEKNMQNEVAIAIIMRCSRRSCCRSVTQRYLRCPRIWFSCNQEIRRCNASRTGSHLPLGPISARVRHRRVREIFLCIRVPQ